MNWGNPKILFLLLIIPLFIIIVAWSNRSRKKHFLMFAEQRFYNFYTKEFSFFYWNLKAVILLFAIFFLIIAAARPQWNKEVQTVKKEGIDIVVCIDVSKSMDATDIAPSRLERAKDQISLFIDQLRGDRIAIVSFAGRSLVQCPMTDDYNAAKLFLSLLDTETVSNYGTNIGIALKNAVSLFQESQKYKIILLISDGEDLEEEAIDIAAEIGKQGAVIYALGVGSQEGSTIMVRNESGQKEYAKDDAGNIIMTKLDASTLSQIAQAGNGRFFSVTPQQAEIFEIMKDISSIEKKKIDSREFTRYEEKYKYFVVAALIILILESVIFYRRKTKNQRYI